MSVLVRSTLILAVGLLAGGICVAIVLALRDRRHVLPATHAPPRSSFSLPLAYA